MADRYWVGGAGTWDATTTTNWSTLSGGGGGASAPTSADNVIFDSSSNATAYAVTVGTNAVAQDITIAGPLVGNVTITSGATAVINVYGSWTSAATGVVFTTTTGAQINFLATTTGKTITTNNVTLGAMVVTLNGVGGEWSLGSAFTCTNAFIVTAGVFSTSASNYAFTPAAISSSNSNVRSISLNASTVTLSGTSPIVFTTATNLTFNAGTSTITCSGSSPVFNGGSQTFNNVNFTSTGTGTTTITGANTFANLNQSSTTSAIRVVVFSANQTVTGTLTLGAANTAVLRTIVRTDAIGTQRTLTVATIATLADVDFQDIVAAGASGTWSGTRLGNCTNNSNITFDPGKTVYWNLAGAQNWNATGWAASSGASPAVNNFPLAQDTAVFDDTGAVTGTITIQVAWMLPAINIQKTGAMTLASGTQAPRIFGGVTLQAATVTTGTGAWTYAAYGVTSTFTSNGATFTAPLTINAPTGGITLADAFTQPSTVTTTLTAGTLNLASYTLSAGLFTSAGTNTLAFGTGNITLTGVGTIFTGSTTTTVTGTPQIICTNSSASARTLTPGAVTEANSISFRITAGTGTLGLTAGSYRNLDFTDGTNPTGYGGALTGSTSITIYGDLKASTNMTVGAGSGVFTFAATSGTKTINTAGVTFDKPFTFNGVGGTFQLQAALTSGSTRTCTLTNGTLDLASYTFTTGAFNSNNSNVRTLAFGTGKIVLTGTGGALWTTSTATNLTVTGTNPLIQLTTAATTSTRTVTMGAAGESNAISVDVTAGSDTISFGTSAGAFKNIDFTGFTGTYTSTNTISCYGNWNWGGVTSSTATVGMTFAATSGTKTITSNGKSFSASVQFTGVGGTWSLQDAFAISLATASIVLTNGTLTTNGFAVTTGLFSSSNTNTRVLNLGASTVTISGTGTNWDITTSTNMTLNAGTSNIVFTGTASAVTMFGGGLTYYNVTAPNALYRFSIADANNTFNNLTATNTTAGEKTFLIVGNQTINGTLIFTGSAGNCRIILFSSVFGTPVILTAGAVSLTDVDFRDIDANGSAIPWTGTRLGDCGGNSDITFATPKTVYWNKVAGGYWMDDAWAASSGGLTATTNQPLPQDTAIFDNTGINASSTVSFINSEQTGALNCSTLTNAISFDFQATTGSPSFYGNVTLSSSVSTITSTASITASVAFAKRIGTQVITSAGVSYAVGCTFNATTAQLFDNLTTLQTATLGINTLNLNGKILTCNAFSSSNTNTRAIAFNSGSIDITGNAATVWSCADLTNFSYTGTPTVNFTYSGSTGTRAVNHGVTGGTEANALDFNITAGSDIWAPSLSGNIVRNLNFTGYSGSSGFYSGGFIYGNLTLSPTQTISGAGGNTTFASTSGTKTITTNGVTIDRGLVFDGIGGAWSLQDALTLGTRTIQFYAGTLTTNSYAVSVGKFGGSTATGNRTLNLGSSSFTCLGSSTSTASWQVEDSGFSYTINAGTSTIFMSEPFTGTSTQNFIGGGKTYYNVVYTTTQPGGFVQGNNTFNSISNTAQPLTLSFEAGSIQTVNNFNVSGTAGNLVTLNSLTPGSQFTLAKNTGSKVLVSYVSITDSAATPAGYWFSPTSQGNVDGGNNTGWNFGATGATSGFLALF